jgi:hypothetical protein
MTNTGLALQFWLNLLAGVFLVLAIVDRRQEFALYAIGIGAASLFVWAYFRKKKAGVKTKKPRRHF